jgi:peptidoglycan/LPS O-acetylase OafA/YrhL
MSFSNERKNVAGQGEIFELTGLRGVAALMVALLHFNFDVAGGLGSIYENLTRIGFMGVDLFFILSGFVIAYKYHDIRRFWSRDYAQFLWFRFWRIYPTHFFVTMFYVSVVVTVLLLGRHVDLERFSVSSLVANLLMVQSWLGSDTLTWNVPAWSVSAEWLAYMLFPVLITSSSQVPRSLVIVACGALLLLVPAIFATLDISGAGFTGLVRLFPEFLSGCLIWRIYSHDMTRARIFDVALIVVLVLMLISGLYLPTDYPFLVLPLFACAIYLSCRSIGIASRILSSRPMVYLGTISYSLYLVHWPVLTVFRNILPASTPLALRLLITLAAATLCAALTYHFVEAPCRRFGKMRWGSASTRQRAAVQAG